MRIRCAKLAAALLLCLAHGASGSAASDPEPGTARVEARSADLFAVGTVHGTRMTIHLSQTSDNAPVRDAVVNVLLRGTMHAATAQTDGSYSFESPDLALPGVAAVQFQVIRAGAREELNGTFDIANVPGKPQTNTPRQMLWWVLNFAVVIGFLMLWRRRKGTGS